MRAALVTIGGGVMVVIGALLPFVTYSGQDADSVLLPDVKNFALGLGITIAVLGVVMTANSSGARRISGILALVVAILALVIFVHGVDVVSQGTSDGFGDTVSLTPGAGLILAIIGSAAAVIGAVMSLRRRSASVPVASAPSGAAPFPSPQARAGAAAATWAGAPAAQAYGGGTGQPATGPQPAGFPGQAGPAGFCGACGTPVVRGDSVCRRCGAAV
jgi:hypothetical protein